MIKNLVLELQSLGVVNTFEDHHQHASKRKKIKVFLINETFKLHFSWMNEKVVLALFVITEGRDRVNLFEWVDCVLCA